MAIDPAAPRSRRTILTAALGGAGALVAHELGRATPALAADSDPLLLGKGSIATENAATSPTIVNSTASPAFAANSGVDAITDGTAIEGTSGAGIGVLGISNGPVEPATARSAGVVGLSGGAEALSPEVTLDEVGVYGAADVSLASAGVWGNSGQGIGVVGTGDWGVYGFGPNAGSVSVFGDSASFATGVYGFSGDDNAPLPTAGAGVVGRAGPGAHYGVVAAAAASNQFGLYVAGRTRLSAGSGGRASFSSTATSKKITLAGVTTSTLIVATLQTSISGCYVRAVVPTTNAFTIYLSKAPGKTAIVGYMIAN